MYTLKLIQPRNQVQNTIFLERNFLRNFLTVDTFLDLRTRILLYTPDLQVGTLFLISKKTVHFLCLLLYAS